MTAADNDEHSDSTARGQAPGVLRCRVRWAIGARALQVGTMVLREEGPNLVLDYTPRPPVVLLVLYGLLYCVGLFATACGVLAGIIAFAFFVSGEGDAGTLVPQLVAVVAVAVVVVASRTMAEAEVIERAVSALEGTADSLSIRATSGHGFRDAAGGRIHWRVEPDGGFTVEFSRDELVLFRVAGVGPATDS